MIMNRYFLLLLIITSPVSNANKMAGKWIQDIDKQIEFNNLHSVMSSRDLDISKCGNQNIWFDDIAMVVSQEKTVCNINGNEVTIYPYNKKYYYRVLFENDKEIYIEYADSSGSEVNVVMYYFVNEGLFWTYYYGDESDNKHQRLYFKKESRGPGIKGSE